MQDKNYNFLALFNGFVKFDGCFTIIFDKINYYNHFNSLINYFKNKDIIV